MSAAELSQDADPVVATKSDPTDGAQSKKAMDSVTTENKGTNQHDSLAELAEIKKRPFSVKVDYAAALMPRHLLRAGAPNPISMLHSLTSDGLHARSEEECVDIFDRCKLTFEYLFANLRPSAQQARAYHQSLAKLTKTPPAQKDNP